jgi:hypothetical protein
VCFGAADTRWCGVGGQVDAAVGAEVVAAGEGFSADEIVGVTCAPGLRLFGFNGWFSSPARGHERVCRPAGPPMWGLFVPAGVEPGVPFVMAP